MSEIRGTPEPTTLLSPEVFNAIPEIHDELGDAITVLWDAHLNAKNVVRATNEELRTLRAQLGAQLSIEKDVLAKPGRSGEWSAFLKARAIPRATADRLVASHQKPLRPKENVLSEATSEPTKEEMAGLFNSILPKLRHYLKTPSSVYSFVEIFADYFQCAEITNGGILILKAEAAHHLRVSVS